MKRRQVGILLNGMVKCHPFGYYTDKRVQIQWLPAAGAINDGINLEIFKFIA